MDRYKLKILAEAQNDIDQIADKHLKLVGAFSAEKNVARIYNTIELILENPFMGIIARDKVLAQKSYRTMVCGKYICFYKIKKDTVVIYRILDRRTDYRRNNNW